MIVALLAGMLTGQATATTANEPKPSACQQMIHLAQVLRERGMKYKVMLDDDAREFLTVTKEIAPVNTKALIHLDTPRVLSFLARPGLMAIVQFDDAQCMVQDFGMPIGAYNHVLLRLKKMEFRA